MAYIYLFFYTLTGVSGKFTRKKVTTYW